MHAELVVDDMVPVSRLGAEMSHVLITGMSGVGKTAVVRELRRRGHICIDMDEPGWSFMDSSGHQHWEVGRLEDAMMKAADGTLFVAGCAEEQRSLRHRFRMVILLSAPLDVMLERVRSRSGSSFGQSAEEMAHILDDLEKVEPALRSGCTHEIDTRAPVSEVVVRILELERGERRDGSLVS